MRRLRFTFGPLDDTDLRLLEALARDARRSNASLARAMGMSAPAVAERIKRLEENGVIQGFGARIDPRALGLPLGIYLRVRPLPGQLDTVADILANLGEVVSCDRVTGEDCFIAKAYVDSLESMEDLIDRLIPYSMTNTSVIQSSPVESRLPKRSREDGRGRGDGLSPGR